MLSRAKILVVDDEQIVRIALRRLLEAEGYDVHEAPNASVAERIAKRELPNLILCDIHLGEGLAMKTIDGIDLCTRLKSDPKTRPLPIIMITSMSDEQHARESIKAGASDFIVKPYNSDRLLDRVKLIALKSTDPSDLYRRRESSEKREIQSKPERRSGEEEQQVTTQTSQPVPPRRRGSGLASKMARE